jgi:hypothetical protein
MDKYGVEEIAIAAQVSVDFVLDVKSKML